MSYSDIGKQAKDFFGKKSGLSQAKSFTMKAKTSPRDTIIFTPCRTMSCQEYQQRTGQMSHLK